MSWESQQKAVLARRKSVIDVIDRNSAAKVMEDFFLEFSQFHSEWLRELVRKYKERGMYPVFPTQIGDYYTDTDDKVVAILSSLCMCWGNGKELEQIAHMRRLMGKQPFEFLRNREFATLSVGREQDKHLDGYMNARYWKIARMFDLLYDACWDRGVIKSPAVVFKRRKLDDFVSKVTDVFGVSGMAYKKGVIDIVLRTSDGIGRGLLAVTPNTVRCPYSSELMNYLKAWFPDWGRKLWTWDEAVRLFRLEYDYDFFYAFLAHQELASVNPKACSKYLARYRSRWEYGSTFPKKDWVGERGKIPEIKFE